MKPRNPAVIKVAKKAFSNGNNTYHIEPKNKYNINANITATAVPKMTKSDSIYSIISVAIIDGPPR